MRLVIFLLIELARAQPAAWGRYSGRNGWSGCSPRDSNSGEPEWNQSVSFLENDLIWNKDPQYSRLRDSHDHAYTNEDHDMLLDYYQPASVRSDYPLYIYLHGGGLQVGDREGVHNTAKKLCRKMAQESFVAASIQYRELGGGGAMSWTREDIADHPELHLDSTEISKHLIPSLDMRMAMYFFTSRDYYKINEDNIFAGGCSAGAIVVTWAAFTSFGQFMNDRTGTVGNIQGVLAFSTGMDSSHPASPNEWVTTPGNHIEVADDANQADYYAAWHKVPKVQFVCGDDGGTGSDHHKEMAFVWQQKPAIEQALSTSYLHVHGGGHSPIHPWDEYGYHNAASTISGPMSAPYTLVVTPYWCTVKTWVTNSLFGNGDAKYEDHHGYYGKGVGGGHRRLRESRKVKDVFV